MRCEDLAPNVDWAYLRPKKRAPAQAAFRRKIYTNLSELQADLDQWINHYNHQRTHQGKMCCGRTPFDTMIAGKEIYDEKVTQLN